MVIPSRVGQSIAVVAKWFLLLLLWSTNLLVSAQEQVGGLCWMQYSMADNDLHSFLVNDINEMAQSELIRDPSGVTWIYVDGSPRAQSFVDVIEGLVDPNGLAVGLYQGVRYVSWDHEKGALVLKEELGELNSDDPQNLEDFLVVALADCVAKGKSEYMLILSSHGSGFGFGGDEHHSRRRLEQSNLGTSSAIQGALQSVQGAPDRLDLLAFDACLQASLESLKDFQNATKYYMASEATEPGTGYAYDKLTPQSNVLDLARQSIEKYITTPSQSFMGIGIHQPPKTLALFDLDKIDPFYQSWEALCSEMTRIMTAHNDTKFYSMVTKSRANTATFSGALDVPSGEPNEVLATMDIGDFLEVFSKDCDPQNNTTLSNLLEEAKRTYPEMILEFGKGPQTPQPATGMAVVWVSRKMYLPNAAGYDRVLFNESQHYFQNEAPLYSEFLYQFVNYDETLDKPGDGTSICGCPTVLPKDGQLMWDRDVRQINDNQQVQVHAKIADSVDSVLMEFGVDVTSLLTGLEPPAKPNARGRHRLLRRKLFEWQERVLKSLHPKEARICSKRHLVHSSRRTEHKVPRGHRRAQEAGEEEDALSEESLGDDYFLVFGGMADPDFDCSGFRSSWDKNFYVLMNTTDGEPEDFLYVYQGSSGEFTIPVIYFPESTTDAVRAELQTKMDNFELTIEDAEALGGEWSNLQLDASTLENLPEGQEALPLDFVALYTPTASGLALAETDTSQGGFFLPMLYVESQLAGIPVDYLIGGFYSRIIEWKENVTLGVAPISAERTTSYLGVNTTVIDLVAYDYVAEGVEPNVQYNYYLITHGEDGEVLQIEDPEASTAVRFQGGLIFTGVVTMILWLLVFHF